MILVTGATGIAGSEVVRALLERGRHVRVFVRDRQKADALFGDGVESVLGDFSDTGSLRRALAGVDDVFLSCADDPRRVGWETSAIDAAAAMNVRRIVKLSAIGAEPGAPVAFWDWHGRVEEHLRECGVPAVILRASFYMSNVLAAAGHVARDGRIHAPAAGARISMIDPRDVGAAAAVVLTTDPHGEPTHLLTGPEAITYTDVATALSTVTGRHVDFVDVPDAQAEAVMIQAGLPEFLAAGIVGAFALAREGAAEQVTSTVESLTGRPARSFAAWAHDHAEAFEPVHAGAAR